MTSSKTDVLNFYRTLGTLVKRATQLEGGIVELEAMERVAEQARDKTQRNKIVEQRKEAVAALEHLMVRVRAVSERQTTADAEVLLRELETRFQLLDECENDLRTTVARFELAAEGGEFADAAERAEIERQLEILRQRAALQLTLTGRLVPRPSAIQLVEG